MCGFIQRVTDNQSVIDLLDQLGVTLDGHFEGEPHHQNFYPAFGGNTARQIKQLLIEENGTFKLVDATWWFDCAEQGDSLITGPRTTFNARNLNSNYWTNALKNHRAIVIATAFGESKRIGKTKHQYLMESHSAFALGALYRPYKNGQYSCAVITRDAHPKMTAYHDKAFPFFLPNDPDFLKLWLTSDETHHEIEYQLNHPTLYPTLNVSRVKTFKSGEKIKSFTPVVLESDII